MNLKTFKLFMRFLKRESSENVEKKTYILTIFYKNRLTQFNYFDFVRKNIKIG